MTAALIIIVTAALSGGIIIEYRRMNHKIRKEKHYQEYKDNAK